MYKNMFYGRWFQRFCWVMMTWVTLYMTGSVFGSIFHCTPVKAAWDFTIPNYHCIDLVLFFRINAIQNIVTDIIIYLAPIIKLKQLPGIISWKQRTGVALMFLCGFA